MSIRPTRDDHGRLLRIRDKAKDADVAHEDTERQVYVRCGVCRVALATAWETTGYCLTHARWFGMRTPQEKAAR